MGSSAYQQPFSTVRLLPERLAEPLSVKAPTLWFVNSMSDLFQSGVPDSFIAQTFDTMRAAHWHTFQILTKRPERMQRYFASHEAPPENAWLGTSVENIKQGVPRIALLASVRAATRFLSIEPLLEDLGTLDLTGIHSVIVGGESGHVGAIHPSAVQGAKSPVLLQAMGRLGAGRGAPLQGGQRADLPRA